MPFIWLAFLNLIEFKNQLEKNSTHIDKQSVEFILLNNPLTLSYHAMNLFVKIFMPTLFFDDDFICLQSCFCLLRLLLKYHDPEICNVLLTAGVPPELYATSWFFTLFANKCQKVELILELWIILLQVKVQGINFDNL